METHCFDFDGVVHTSVTYEEIDGKRVGVALNVAVEELSPNHVVLRLMESLERVYVIKTPKSDTAERFFQREDIRRDYPGITKLIKSTGVRRFFVEARAVSKLDVLQDKKCTHFYDDSEHTLDDLRAMIFEERLAYKLEHVYYVRTMHDEPGVMYDLLPGWKKSASSWFNWLRSASKAKPEQGIVTRLINGVEFEFKILKKGELFFKGQAQRCKRIKSGWVTKDETTASKYAPGGTACCYRLVRDAAMFYLSKSNLRKLQETGVPKDVFVVSRDGYDLLSDLLRCHYVPNRSSDYVGDAVALKGMCHLFKHDDDFRCDGYAAPRRLNTNGVTFHSELAFCRPHRVLELCSSHKIKLLPVSADPEWTGESLPEWVTRKAFTKNELKARLGREPTKEEVEQFMEGIQAEIKKIVDTKAGIKSLNSPVAGFTDERTRILQAVSRNGMNLQHAGAFRADREIAFVAVRQNERALRYVSDELRSDPDFLMDALQMDDAEIVAVN